MSRLARPLTGGCRCGRVRLRVGSTPLLTMACHCTGCQTMSASAFSLTAIIPSDGFELVDGATEIGGLHGPAHHHFCGWCKSWMFTRVEGMDWFVNLRPSMLDERAWFVPFVETYTSEKLPWASTPAKHSFERFPPLEAYEGLMKAFAESGIGPSAA